MLPENEWEAVRGSGNGLTTTAGMGLLRISLLFGSAAIALLVTPVLNRFSQEEETQWSSAPGIDYTQTGSIGYNGSYTIRRSVLQGSAGSICVIRDNGTRSGDCQ